MGEAATCAAPGAARAGLKTGVPALSALLILGACSGRSGPPPVPPAPPPVPDCIPTHGRDCLTAPEFRAAAEELAAGRREDPGFGNQWGLEAVGAHRAYAHVGLLEGEGAAPGAGVTIGVIDSGIDVGHPAFSGKTVHRGFLFGAAPETGERFSHGTAVASIAAGARTADPEAPHGVAWGADLAVWAIPLSDPDNVYEPITRRDARRGGRPVRRDLPPGVRVA